jgi:enoyl-CoA hydratase
MSSNCIKIISNIPKLSLKELLSAEISAELELLGPLIQVTHHDHIDLSEFVALIRRLPIITFTSGFESGLSSPELDAAVDMVVSPDWLPLIESRVNKNPKASIVLAQLLRATENMNLFDAISLESIAYSALQSGEEFADWITKKSKSDEKCNGEVIVVEDLHHTKVILNRPSSANAINVYMRTQLVSVMQTLAYRSDEIELIGYGENFCAGGDLNEFGLVTSPLIGHMLRMKQNLPASFVAVANRLTAHVQGACIGAGLELSSFAKQVIAKPCTKWRLPEVSMGLLPGCGGTVSISRRIGRQNTLLFAISDKTIDVSQALNWGLIDKVTN